MDDNSEKLRAKAKEELRQGKTIDTSLYETDMKVLVEELSIYQIELEHQNHELIQSQVLLQQSNDRYLDLFDNAPIGYMIVDINGLIKNINQTAANLLALSKNEFVGTKITKFIHPDYQDIYYLYFQTLIHHKQHQPCDIKLRKANNSFFYARIQGVCQTGKIDHEAEFRLAISDISIQKEMEIKLLAAKEQSEQSEERYKLLADNVPDIIYSLNGEGYIMAINNSAFNRYGYTEQDARGMPFLSFVFPDDLETVQNSFNRARQEQRKYTQGLQFRMAAKNGEIHWLELNSKARFDLNGAYLGEDGVLRDITDRKKAEEALQQSELRFKVLFDEAPDAMLLADPDTGKIIAVNNNACSLFKREKHELIGLFQYELHPPQSDDYTKNTFKQQFENAKALHDNEPVENRIVCSDGTEITVEIVGQAIHLDGKMLMLGTFRDITERKKAEEAIKKIGQHYQALIEKAPDGIALIDAQGNFTYVSPSAKKMFGYLPTDEVLGNPAVHTHPDDLQRVVSELGKIFADPAYIPIIEYRFIDKQGQWLWVETTFSNLLANESVEAIVLNFRDITERKKVELSLKQSEARYALVIDASEQGIWDWNVETNEVYFSEQWKKQIGYENNELKNDFTTWIEHLHPDEKEYCQNAVNAYLEQPVEHFILQFRFRHKDGRYRWIHNKAASLKNSEGKVIRMFGAHTDITEPKQAEEALRKSREMMVSSQSVAHICSYSTNLNVNDLSKSAWECSPEFYKIFGIDESYPHTIEGWAAFIHPDHRDEIVAYHEEVVRKRLSFNQEYRIIRFNDGVERWVHGTGVLEYDKLGTPIRMYGAIQDITEQKQIEQELIKAKDQAEESDRLKSAFLANMSHEIRTPMNGILGFADLLKDKELTGEEQQEYIAIIEKSGVRMLNIINEIIDISKIEAGLMKLDLEETNINEQIEYIFTFFKPEVETKGLVISYNAPLTAQEATITADREKVYAILTNLVKNAIKYTNNGSIEFGYNLVEADGRQSLRFYVKDTGIGIPKERQQAIFERFIQADISDILARQGAGLGLSITKAYVEMLGGTIWVESEEGVGSTFYFTLPFQNDLLNETVNPQVLPSVETKTIKKLKILIAEDDDISAQLMERTIRSYSKELLKVRTGTEAVATCRQHPDIDLVLMDIRMPEMNGYEATRQIREYNQQVVIIAQTAYGLSGDREKAIEAGCTDYVAKPINKALLSALILKYCTK